MKLYALYILLNCAFFALWAGGEKEGQPQDLQAIRRLLEQQDILIKTVKERMSKLANKHKTLEQEVTLLEESLSVENQLNQALSNQHEEK